MTPSRALLVEIGTPAELPVVTPPEPRPPSSWTPNPRPSPGLAPPTGLAVAAIADAAVLSWTRSTAPGAATVIESAPDNAGVPGIWREVDRTGAESYTLSLPGGARWVRVRAELNGRTSVATNAVLAELRSSEDLEQSIADLVEEQLQQDQALADEKLQRQQEDARVATEAAQDAANKVQAEAQQRADDLLNERLAWTAAVESEATTRESEFESLAQAMAQVSAGTGEQFDPKRIWYFDEDLESWGGNGTPTIVDGWLRPANHATGPSVFSPAGLSVEGKSYRFVKARVKRVGNPEWRGRLYWKTVGNTATWSGPATIPEPDFNADGTATIDWDDVGWWPGTVTQIRLDVSGNQTATDYYLIDWVAIGRPTPGAGVALVQQVQQALVTADAAEALARETLAAQMRGDYTGTDVTQVTQGLVWSERQARVTAISAEASEREALAALVNDPETGLPKAHARITEVSDTAAAANEVTANRVAITEAALDSIGGNGVNVLWTEYTHAPGAGLPERISHTGGLAVDTVVSPLGVSGRVLRLQTTTANTAEEFRLSQGTSDYNLPLTPGEYIVSFYAWSSVAGHTIRGDLIETGGVQRAGADIPLTTGVVRYSRRYTITQGNSRLRFLPNRSGASGRSIYLDRLMIERAVGPSAQASAWVPGTATRQVEAQAGVLSSTVATVSQHEDDIDALSLSLLTTNARIDNLPEVYVQPTKPAGTAYDVGDQWIDTSTPENKLHTWDGSDWIAGVTMQGATIFVGPTAPVANAVGDLWYDPAHNNRPHRWNGSIWVDISDPRVAATADTVAFHQSQIQQNADGLVTLGDLISQVAVSVGGKGSNVLRGEHTFFPSGSALPSLYSTGGLTVDSVLTSLAYGGRALRVRTTTTNVAEELSLGTSTSDYNAPLEPGDYLVSFVAWSSVAGHQIRADVIENGGVQRAGPTTALTGAPVRYSHRITVGPGAISGRLRFLPNRSGVSGRTVYLDRLMIEPVRGSSSTPSPWVPGSAAQQSLSNASATSALSAELQVVNGIVSGHTSSIEQVQLDIEDKADLSVTQQLRAEVDEVTGKVGTSYTVNLNANGYHSGVVAQNNGQVSSWRFLTDTFGIYNTSGAGLSWTDGTLWNARGAVSMIAGPTLGDGMTFYLGPTPISPAQARRSDAVFSVNADGAKVKGLLEGSLLDTGALSRNSTRIHTGNGRLAPFVIKAGGYASGGAPANRNIDVANIISPDYLSGYHFRRMAWRKSDVFLEAHVSGDGGDETLQIYVAYDGGAWELIASVTVHLGNRSAFPLLVRYTTKTTSWNVVSFNCRTTQGRTHALAFKVEVDNFNESSNAANSNSGTNPGGDVGGTPPSAGNGGGNDGGFRPGFPVVVP